MNFRTKLASMMATAVASMRLKVIMATAHIHLPSDMLGLPEINRTSDLFESDDDGNTG